jgi:hypothetical protein
MLGLGLGNQFPGSSAPGRVQRCCVRFLDGGFGQPCGDGRALFSGCRFDRFFNLWWHRDRGLEIDDVSPYYR